MPSRPSPRSTTGSSLSFAMLIAIAITICCILLGGASRADSLPDFVLRPILVVLALGTLLFAATTDAARRLRPLAWCVAALAALIALQLVPLPAAWWSALPGHALFLDAARIAGIPQPWRPLSISPDLTLSSLFALIPVGALLVAMERLGEREVRRLLDVLVAMLGIGMVLGVIQASTGGLYLHQFTYPGSAVGFFSNRNHEAAFLAMGFPMLRLWVDDLRGRDPRVRFVLAVLIALMIWPLIFLTGSRAGVALGVFGMVAALAILPLPVARLREKASRVGLALIVGIGLAVVAALLWVQRASSIERLAAASDLQGELRLRTLPTTLGMVRDYLPTGSGFGTFDPAFRIAEPDTLLKPTYFNHAHNELIELLITGGIPAIMVLAAFLYVVGRAAIEGWNAADRHNRACARLGVVMLIILGAASIVDYPLRTAHMMAVATIAAAWIMLAARPASGVGETPAAVASPGT